jgi:DNA-binding transcriptional MerR regulator
MNTREQLQTLLQSHSMREIGRAAGVTHHTVSKFLNGSSIKPESFKKIDLAVTNLTQLDAQKVVWAAGMVWGESTPDTKQAQIAELIARLAAADVEREQIMRRCNCHGQSDSQWTYPEQIAMLERDIQSQRKIIEDAHLERQEVMRRCNMQADNLRMYQERVALLECEIKVYKPALEAAENACVYHQQETMDAHHDHALTMDDLRSWVAEYNALARAHDLLTAEHATAHADSLFLQGLRIGFKYTGVFLVLLLITAAVCWFGGV